MSIGGFNICDFCGKPVLQDDVAPLKIEEDGHLHQRHFHNRHSQDCLAQQISILQEELAVAE